MIALDLEGIKKLFEEVSLSHQDICSFQIGSNYNIAENNANDHYPVAFYELPYSIENNLKTKKDSIQFSFNVFLKSKPDDVISDHQAISMAKLIGDAILFKINDQATSFTIESANAVSVMQYSDDDVSGIRYDLVITAINPVCDYTLAFR